MIIENISQGIGNTPMVKLNKICDPQEGEILAKLEYYNPGGSVKDRIALAMIERGERSGKLGKESVIIEPTSGNTGIGLAMVAAAKGYKLVLTMPDTMSDERKKILRAYGAELVLTPGAEGMKGAIEKAKELAENTKKSFIPDQFANPANATVHETFTGPEILRSLGGRKVDAFVFGVGTGGTLTGVARCLKKNNIDSPVFAVEPENSPVLSGGKPGPHKIQGIGAGFVPQVLDTSLISEVIKISNEEAFAAARNLASSEGLFVGISSGAVTAACRKIINENRPGKKPLRIVTLFPSNGERYLSTELFAHLL
ncbi:MAG: cysteine synthase A [Candidatus Rifleibacteriota bacterium]